MTQTKTQKIFSDKCPYEMGQSEGRNEACDRIKENFRE